MKKNLLTFLSVGLLAGAGFLGSCDDEPDGPSISLSETEVTASSGDEVSIDVTTITDGGFKELVVTKLWDGASQGAETFTSPLTTPYTYTVTDEDADHVLTLNFTVTDKEGKTASKELVILIELLPSQLLLKYNWRLSEEIRKKTGLNDIKTVYDDDVYRFNADGTYDKSIGAKVDDFNDLVQSYCYYNINDNTLRLLMSRRDHWFNVNVVDTLDIILIDETKLHANTTYYGLDQLDDGTSEVPYEAEEDYEKRFVAVAKTNSFDPYQAGTADDAGPGACVPIELDNGRVKGKN